MKKQFLLTVEMPENVSVSLMKSYLSDAVNTWWGQFEPHVDPLWDLKEIKVKTAPKIPKK